MPVFVSATGNGLPQSRWQAFRAWSEWLACAGVLDLSPLRTTTVDRFVSAVQAATG